MEMFLDEVEEHFPHIHLHIFGVWRVEIDYFPGSEFLLLYILHFLSVFKFVDVSSSVESLLIYVFMFIK